MKREPLPPLDISDTPELLRLAEQVAAAQAPITLCREGKALAVLTPAKPEPVRRSRPRVKKMPQGKALSVADRTFGSLSRYRLTSPASIEEEKEAFAQAVAEEVVESMRREAADGADETDQ